MQDKKVQNSRIWNCEPMADDALKEGNYETSIEHHLRFLKNDPENGLALYHLGYAYGQMGDHLSEIVYYKKAIDSEFIDNDGIFFNLGMAYAETGQPENAVLSFKRALTVNPGNTDTLCELGMVYRQMNNYELAEETFTKATLIDPDLIKARFGLSIVYFEEGLLRDAFLELKQILKADPANKDARALLDYIINKD